MFESICIRRDKGGGTPIDLGLLAESMVFYQKVHVVADHEVFSYLLRVCGPESLLAAMEQGFLQLSYLENQLGVSTVDQGRPSERYGLHFVSSRRNTFLPLAERKLIELTGRAGKSRRLATRFSRLVDPVLWEQPEAQAAKRDLLDAQITDASARILLQEMAPGCRLPQDAIFRVLEVPDALVVETNLDLVAAQRRYKQLNPDSSFGIATIIVAIFEALADLRFSARFSSDIAVSSSTSAIAELKLARLLERYRQNNEQITLFQEWTLDSGRAIRDSVNYGHRSFDDILKLVASAAKFKDWLMKCPEDAGVRREYLTAVSRIDWADKLPAKSIRWLLFTAVGAALGSCTTPMMGVATGALLETVDEFIIDRLVKGWKPNQFIEASLKAFVQGRGQAAIAGLR